MLLRRGGGTGKEDTRKSEWWDASATGKGSVFENTENNTSFSTAMNFVPNNNIATNRLSSNKSTTDDEKVRQQQQQGPIIGRLKLVILTFFILTAVGVGVAFALWKNNLLTKQQQNFYERFQQDSCNVLAAIGQSLDSTLAGTDSFALSLLVIAKSTNQSWPFVTIPNYYVQAKKLLKNSHAKIVNTYHLVEEKDRQEWEDYTSQNNYWVEESIQIQADDPSYNGPNITDDFLNQYYTGHYDLIHGYEEYVYGWENGTTGVSHDGPYLPWYQCVPVIPIYPIYNWDLSTAAFKDPWSAVLQTHKVTITEPYMIADPWDEAKQAENEAEAEWIKDYLQPGEEPLEPISDIYYPIVEEAIDSIYLHDDDNGASYDPLQHNLGGILAVTIYWRDLLRDLLPTGSNSIVVVFDNPCAPTFTYRIAGPVPEYLGTGPYNSTYAGNSKLEKKTSLLDVWSFGIKETGYTGAPVNENVCPFSLSVYPSEENHDGSTADTFTVPIVLILVFVGAIMTVIFSFLFFYAYDKLVRNEIQSKKKLLEAKRSFVRFVSHEVRTPLNTVSMGLTLLHQDFMSAIDEEKGRLQQPDTGSASGLGNEEYSVSTAGIDISGRVNMLNINGGTDDNSSGAQLVPNKDLIRWSLLTREANQNAEVAVGVLNDLLNIDRIQMGAFKLELEILPIWNLIEQTTLEFNAMAAKQEVDLKLDLSNLAECPDVERTISNVTTLPESILNQKVVGDGARVCQVVRNLVSNAIKFSKYKSVTVKVCITAAVDKEGTSFSDFRLVDGRHVNLQMSGRVNIYVTDTGAGMTPSELKTVFDVGTQFNARGLQGGGGSGLGLAFAKAIAEQHGGSLEATSDGPSRGSTFELVLPLYFDSFVGPNSNNETTEIAKASQSSPSAIERQEEAEEALESLHILVVDDVLSNRKLLMQLLKSKGHSCEGAENGQDAIDKVKDCMEANYENNNKTLGYNSKRMYDCILLDYEMPFVNGPEACKVFREMGCSCIVVGVTGNLLAEDVEFFMGCGANAVLPKPFKYKELQKLLTEYGMGWA